jgi:putative flippase GtrA
MISLVTELFAFFFKQPPAVVWRRIRGQDMPWIVQLAVYGFCGVATTIVGLTIVQILNTTIIPADDGMIVNGVEISDELRGRNLLINNSIAFLPTNLMAYFLNVMLVFRRGRHHPWVEFFHFTLINFVSFALSQVAGPWIVHYFGVPTKVAMLTNAVFAAAINFVSRKFFVFKG